MVPPPKYPRLSNDRKTTLLRRILDRSSATHSHGGRSCVVFDLDGTLVDNRPRTLAILRELAEHWAAQALYPTEVARLRTTVLGELAYLASDSLALLGVSGAAAQLAETFWKIRFFSDDYMKHDVALPGAVDFAKGCHERGANLIYFTGRDLPNMGVGSWLSLRDLGFPIGVPGTALVLKPDFDMPDEVYKRTQGPELKRMGTIVGAFDNEPGNCNVLLEQNAGVDSVFIDTQHLPGAPALAPEVAVIDDFRVEG
jgi:hypothetical protein